MQTFETTDDDQVYNANVFLFAGLPGCGKTVAAKAAKEVIEKYHDRSVSTHEISDYVRYEYESNTGLGEISDNDLGNWAAQKKDRNGDGYFARRLATELLQDGVPKAENIVVAGIRSPEEAQAFRERFSTVVVMPIWTLPDERYKRLEAREGEYTYEEFNERKDRELWQWGCIDFFTKEDEYDHIIPNNYSEEKFETEVGYIVETYLHDAVPEMYVESPFPSDLSKRDVGQYL